MTPTLEELLALLNELIGYDAERDELHYNYLETALPRLIPNHVKEAMMALRERR